MSGRTKSTAKEEIQSDEMSLMKRSQPSVEIKKDAKGNFSFVVKVYHDDPIEAATSAKETMDQLQKEFGE